MVSGGTMEQLLEKEEEKQTNMPFVEYDEALLERVKEHIKSCEIDQKTLAQRINYSQGAISVYLQKKYTAKLTALESALRKYLDVQYSTRHYTKLSLGYVGTTVAERINTVAKMCRFNGEISICYGSSGLGKTTAIKQYEEKNSGIIVIDTAEGASPKIVLKDIAEKLKITTLTNITSELSTAITKKLNGSNFLIIIDEAENIQTSVFRALRKIHDRCNFSFGLLFLGTEQLYFNLKNLRGDFVYLTNRIGMVEKLDQLNKEDVHSLVKKAFPDISEENLTYFELYTSFNARILFNTLKRTRDLQLSTGKEINKEMIISAREMLLV